MIQIGFMLCETEGSVVSTRVSSLNVEVITGYSIALNLKVSLWIQFLASC